MTDTNNNSIYRLVNPEFDFEFMGKTYRIRKANLDKAIQYQARLKELDGQLGADSKIIAYCVYLMLKDQEPAITEEIAIQNISADADALEILSVLGFISPSKLETAKKIQGVVMDRLTGEKSS